MEQELFCFAALYSPQTGIVDTHSYMQNLCGDAKQYGPVFVYETSVELFEHKNELIVVGESVGDTFRIKARNVILAAGLHSAKISLEACLPTPPSYWLKGNCFSLRQKAPFEHLIYPVPSSGGLGTHLTIDFNGRAKFGQIRNLLIVRITR